MYVIWDAKTQRKSYRDRTLDIALLVGLSTDPVLKPLEFLPEQKCVSFFWDRDQMMFFNELSAEDKNCKNGNEGDSLNTSIFYT